MLAPTFSFRFHCGVDTCSPPNANLVVQQEGGCKHPPYKTPSSARSDPRNVIPAKAGINRPIRGTGKMPVAPDGFFITKLSKNYKGCGDLTHTRVSTIQVVHWQVSGKVRQSAQGTQAYKRHSRKGGNPADIQVRRPRQGPAIGPWHQTYFRRHPCGDLPTPWWKGFMIYDL